MTRLALIFCVIAIAPAVFAQDAAEGRIHVQRPVFPGGYWQYGIVAQCSVIFSVDDRGYTRDICSACVTNVDPENHQAASIQSEFESSASDAVNRWRYVHGDERAAVVTTLTFSTDNIDGAHLPQPDAPTCQRPQTS